MKPFDFHILVVKNDDYKTTKGRTDEVYITDEIHEILCDSKLKELRNFDMEVIYRDDLHYDKIDKSDIIIVLGGDGTLFTTTHFIKNNYIPIIGVGCGTENYFMKSNYKDVPKIIVNMLINGHVNFKEYYRLHCQVITSTGRYYHIDPCFNEYAIGNNLFGRPSKYKMNIKPNVDCFYRNSGMIVSTLQGMTGWIKNCYPKNVFDKLVKEYESNPDKIFFHMREPMTDDSINHGFVSRIELEIDMVGGLISLDGFKEFPVERGDRIIIEKSKNPEILILEKS